MVNMMNLFLLFFNQSINHADLSPRLASGFADLHRAADWDLDFVTSEIKKQEYTVILKELQNCLSFLRYQFDWK